MAPVVGSRGVSRQGGGAQGSRCHAARRHTCEPNEDEYRWGEMLTQRAMEDLWPQSGLSSWGSGSSGPSGSTHDGDMPTMKADATRTRRERRRNGLDVTIL